MHATTQATNMARIKTEGTKGLLTVSDGRVRVWWKCEGLQTSNQVLWLGPDSERYQRISIEGTREVRQRIIQLDASHRGRQLNRKS
jgi:hypothetical protein